MEFLGKLSLIVHIIAGILTLVAGPIAIFYNFKNIKNHRRAGKVFFYAMLVVCATAVGGVIKYPDAVFYQFLCALSFLVLAGVLRGVRAVFLMKGGAVKRMDWIYTAILALSGTFMVGYGAWLYTVGKGAVATLFLVFGVMSIVDVRNNYRMFSTPAKVSGLDWYKLHIGSMMGAFTASTTAFLVNISPDLPFYVIWFGPTLLLVPIQVYYMRKIAPKRKVTA